MGQKYLQKFEKVVTRDTFRWYNYITRDLSRQ